MHRTVLRAKPISNQTPASPHFALSNLSFFLSDHKGSPLTQTRSHWDILGLDALPILLIAKITDYSVQRG
jgi:hypothetical protein